MQFSAVILAGGRSKRMGRDKALLEFNGRTLLRHQLALVKQLQPLETFISGRPDGDYRGTGCPLLLDRAPGYGPVSGLEQALARSAAPLVLVIPVDMPLVTADFLRALLARCTPNTGVLPSISGSIQPLVGFYPASAHAIAVSCLEEHRFAAREFASRCVQAGSIRLFEIDGPQARCFANWNSPQDLPDSRPTRVISWLSPN